MAIPKTIIQTYKTSRLPWLTRWHINKMKRLNPGYSYKFFDDKGICDFIAAEYGQDMLAIYNILAIGAAKADFFRYAYLYKKGGIYLDIDSQLTGKLDSIISPDDHAIISLEGHLEFYVQWALLYEPEHPFLKRTLEIISANILDNRYPHDVHRMTGPAAYTQAIKECLATSPPIPYREMGIDYDNKFRFSYPGSKIALYGIFKNGHWKKQAKSRTVLN